MQDRKIAYPTYYRIPELELFIDTIKRKLNTYLEFHKDNSPTRKKK